MYNTHQTKENHADEFVKGELKMYENNNTVSIDWKGLFIKLIIVAVIVFAIFKGYEYFSNKKSTTTSTPSAASQLFNANLESLRQAGENYYDYSNYPSEGQTVMVTLAELITKGDIKELYDANGNECNDENSYVSLTNDDGQYKLKATLSCGETSNYTIVMIGCECEGNECDQANEQLEDKKEESKTSSSNSSSSSNKSNSSSNKQNSSNTSKNNNSNNSSNSSNTDKTPVVDMNNNKTTTPTTTKKPTTTKVTTTKKQYKVTFDSNGGDYVAPQYVDKYDTAYEPNEPDKDDARFVGWYYNGRLWDFDNEITKNIKLEAYYWETKETTTTVYSAAWDTYGTSYVTVTHKLAIPAELQESNIKNVRISNIRNARTMSSSYDLQRYATYHTSTFDGYIYSNWDNYSTNANYLGRLYSIRVRKENNYTYDRWVTWSGYVSSQCAQPFTINGEENKCDYGIVYTVEWEYDELTD